MENSITNDLITLYKSVFQGREDVFARRWEKEGKNGYMPAYSFDPYMLKLHKMKGGTFQSYPNKQYLALTNEEIHKHLEGEQFIGVYPLLKDNTSWFLAADFDEENWAEECRQFLVVCENMGIPAYLERSRSGKGGHIWIFLEKPYPAYQSRKIFTTLLEQSGIFSIFDKHSSFDRLFPNQDYLSGKGLGNLIALPFHKTAMDAGNSCFIDPDTLKPYPDQWEFLRSIRKASVGKLDSLLRELPHSFSKTKLVIPGKVNIRLQNAVYINRSGLTTPLINFLKEELNFAITEYFVKKKMGKNTWGTDRYFKMIEETGDDIIVPRGFIGKLIRFCKEQGIAVDFNDERVKKDAIDFKSSIQLRDHQKPALEITAKKDFGVIVAPPGSGKTVVALSVIAKKQQPALIIVHRKQLADQWIDRIESFLGIPKKEIGKIAQGKCSIGKHITVAMVQSLEKAMESEEVKTLAKAFGTIIVDECHHVPAETFRNAISKLHASYVYGLTATPFRKYNDGKLIFIHLGDVISEIKSQEMENSPGAKIIVRNTELLIPFNVRTDKFETVSKVLTHDSSRNKLILEDVEQALGKGKKAVIVTERKEHIDTLFQYLKQKYEAVTLSGEDSEQNKKDKWKILREGNFQVLITTGQYFGEGSDLQKIECLFLVYPFSFEGKLIQYIGRVQRSEVTPTIYDYRDHRIDYLEKLFQKRNAYYKKLYQHGTLFDKPEPDEKKEKNTFVYEDRLKLSLDQLEFRFGAIAFKHTIPEVNTDLEFEVENAEMRPEFDVLKPYFSKILKTKKVKVDVLARFHNGVPVIHSASSHDLSKINREIVDSVKFQFVSKGIIGKAPLKDENLLDLNQIQGEGQNNPLYGSEKELLDDILKNQQIKHRRQLVYLSQKHQSQILKLRFVLIPFSFVFLLTGKQQYHLVWETLDTEEATYVWHIEKNLAALKSSLKRIDAEIGQIRTGGRQQFLGGKAENFSRIVHDYSDERKGFVIWKDLLEEKLK